MDKEEQIKRLNGEIQYLFGEIQYYQKRQELEKKRLLAVKEIVDKAIDSIDSTKRMDDFFGREACVKDNVMPPLEEAEKFLQELITKESE